MEQRFEAHREPGIHPITAYLVPYLVFCDVCVFLRMMHMEHDSKEQYTQWTIKTWQFIFDYNFG